MIATLVILGLIAVALVWGVGIYNGLIAARNAFKNAFAQIDVQLQRRYDLIPNLVETAKAYLKHERETLEAVTAARNTAQAGLKQAQMNPGDPAAMAQLSNADGMLTQVMTRFMAIAEAYPDLKANQNMMQLTEELSSTENKVAFARQAFNDSVMSYNNRREVFPNTILAGIFNFAAAELLTVESAEARVAPKVSFG